MYIYMCMCIYIYVYIYIYNVYICMYIDIYNKIKTKALRTFRTACKMGQKNVKQF